MVVVLLVFGADSISVPPQRSQIGCSLPMNSPTLAQPFHTACTNFSLKLSPPLRAEIARVM